MAVSGTGEAAHNFAQALGLDPKKTHKITLIVEAEEIITVEVVAYPTPEEIQNLTRELKTYELVPKDV